jgi:hypothetical protein
MQLRTALVVFPCLCGWTLSAPAEPLAPDDGYRGIWYFNQSSKDEYRYKYSGGMATYPQQHAPVAVYRREVNRTFFVYGGTTARSPGDKQELLHMVSYFDHATGTVPRPRILLNKHTDDAHDNPTLAIDDAGHLWVFSPSHGTARPSYIHRSTKPYSIEDFERVFTGNFSYPQAWHLPGLGFLFLHTRYGGAGLGVKAQRCLGLGDPRRGHLRQQLRPWLALHRVRWRLAHHRAHGGRPPAGKSGRRDGDVAEPRSRRYVDPAEATHAGQRVQPHLRAPTAGCAPGFLRPLG